MSNKENPFLGRREIECIIKDMCGKIKREDARNLVAQHLNLNATKLYVISLKGSKGTKDVHATLYYYEDEETAKRQLPFHIFLRMLPEEERKKILEEKKKKKKRVVG